MAFRHALFVFPPRGCVFSHGMHGTHRTHLGGYGIPAIPTPPSANPPTEFTEFTEISGGEYSPTDFADAHRLGGYGIPAIPTPPSANPPTEFTEFTEVSGVEEPPTDAHRWLGCLGFCGFCGKIVWRLRGYGRDAIPSYNCTDWGLKFCVFCAIRGKISQQEISVRICAICGRIFQQEVSVGSANSVGGCSGCFVGAVETTAPPGRVRGYGRDAIPSYNCTDWGD